MLPFKDLVPFFSFGIAKVDIISKSANFNCIFFVNFMPFYRFETTFGRFMSIFLQVGTIFVSLQSRKQAHRCQPRN